MNRRDLILGLVVGLVLGAILASAVGLDLAGTAGDDGADEDTGRAADDRILYQLNLDQAEEWLLSYYEEADGSEEVRDQLTETFELMRTYDSEEDVIEIFGDRAVVGPADSVLAEAYARAAGQEVASVEDLEVNDGENGLQVIVGEWSDPYAIAEGPVLRFYLKVPTELNENLPKDWSNDPEISLDKPLETTIFWQNLAGIPALVEN